MELQRCDRHFPFLILYFSFPILDSCGSAPSGRHHRYDRGIMAKLSQYRLLSADFPDLTTLHCIYALSVCQIVGPYMPPLIFHLSLKALVTPSPAQQGLFPSLIFHLSLKALVTPSPAQQGLFPYPPPLDEQPEKGDLEAVSGIIRVVDAASSEAPS